MNYSGKRRKNDKVQKLKGTMRQKKKNDTNYNIQIRLQDRHWNPFMI